MNKIVYLEGSRSVGKTTLLRKIKENNPHFVVVDGYARKEFMLDNTIFEEFVINEKLYLACDVAQHNVYRSLDTVIVVVKGPYTDVFYAESMIKKLYKDKDINNSGIIEYIKKAKQCEPDYIVYLDADKETIIERNSKDDHIRKTMSEFLDNWLDSFSNYYKSFNKTKVINTNKMSPDEVYQEFMKMIEEK